jgi:lysozyme
MELETLKDHIKKEEGFRNKVYLDHLGNRTIGYGHLCLPNEKWDDDKIYDSKELNKTFEYDFNIACNDAEKLIAKNSIHPDAFCVLIDMCFNMGSPRVSKFKKMFAALEVQDYQTASKEMLDSKWANQVPNRARRLSEIMEKC